MLHGATTLLETGGREAQDTKLSHPDTPIAPHPRDAFTGWAVHLGTKPLGRRSNPRTLLRLATV